MRAPTQAHMLLYTHAGAHVHTRTDTRAQKCRHRQACPQGPCRQFPTSIIAAFGRLVLVHTHLLLACETSVSIRFRLDSRLVLLPLIWRRSSPQGAVSGRGQCHISRYLQHLGKGQLTQSRCSIYTHACTYTSAWACAHVLPPSSTHLLQVGGLLGCRLLCLLHGSCRHCLG